MAIVCVMSYCTLMMHLSCDGTFEQNCDPDRAYTDIDDVSLSHELSSSITDLHPVVD